MSASRHIRRVAVRHLLAGVLLLSLTAGAAACGDSDGRSARDDAGRAADVALTGAGASFPYPLYSKWAADYREVSGLKLNYQSVGSGAGIEQIKAKTVDFGASDAPLQQAELDEAGLLQFPLTMGGVVPVINLEGVRDGQLRLDGDTLAAIYLGTVKKWSDPAIAALNADVELPDQDITVVHRSDGSGTTWIFTTYLSAISAQWKSAVGASKEPKWPVGVGGKGNEGVAASVKQMSGAIGYVEYAYAKQSAMVTVRLRNSEGGFVAPNSEAFAAAAANAEWENAPGFALVLVDQPGPDTWPIVGASFILIHREQNDATAAKALLEFFDWCYENGQATAVTLDYVPIPDNVVDLVEAMWTEQVTAGGMPVWP